MGYAVGAQFDLSAAGLLVHRGAWSLRLLGSLIVGPGWVLPGVQDAHLADQVLLVFIGAGEVLDGAQHPSAVEGAVVIGPVLHHHGFHAVPAGKVLLSFVDAIAHFRVTNGFRFPLRAV